MLDAAATADTTAAAVDAAGVSREIQSVLWACAL